MQPAIMDITLDWKLPEGVKPITIPTEPPTSISAGERLTLFAVLQSLDEQVSILYYTCSKNFM